MDDYGLQIALKHEAEGMAFNGIFDLFFTVYKLFCTIELLYWRLNESTSSKN